MSKQEIYAWSSLGFTLSIFVFYLLSAFGWPPGLENYAEYITSLIWKVIVVAFTVELILDLLKSTSFGGVHKDERDILIESKAFRNAYYFVMASLISLIANLFISDFLSEATGENIFMSIPFMTLHALVFILFTASIIKSSTQLYFYQRGV